MESKHPRTMRSAAPWSLAFALSSAFFGGCLKEDSPAGPEQEMEQTAVLEPVRMAGATSSTNWPERVDGGNKFITVNGKADSNLTIDFSGNNQQDTGFHPVRVKGTLILYDGSGIPSLAPVDSLVIPFTEDDTLIIPLSTIQQLPHHGLDTLGLSVRIVVDTMECLISGFYYSRSDRRFTYSPFSANTVTSYYLYVPRFSFQAVLDTIGVSALFTQPRSLELSFYIPGSPHFWRVESTNSINLGLLSKGIHPLRLIRSYPPPSSASTKVEIYEVTISPRIIATPVQSGKPAQIRIGEKLLDQRVDGYLRQRTPPP